MPRRAEFSCPAGGEGRGRSGRDPGPGRVDHLHHHATVALCDHPATRAASTAITGLYVEHQTTLTSSDSDQMGTLQTDEQITPITTIKRHRAAAGRARHRPRPLKTAGVEVRSSSRNSTSTRNPRPTPGHPHSTRKSHISRKKFVEIDLHHVGQLIELWMHRKDCAHLHRDICAVQG